MREEDGQHSLVKLFSSHSAHAHIAREGQGGGAGGAGSKGEGAGGVVGGRREAVYAAHYEQNGVGVLVEEELMMLSPRCSLYSLYLCISTKVQILTLRTHC
jgi:hypothetical protein